MRIDRPFRRWQVSTGQSILSAFPFSGRRNVCFLKNSMAHTIEHRPGCFTSAHYLAGGNLCDCCGFVTAHPYNQLPSPLVYFQVAPIFAEVLSLTERYLV